MPCASLDHGQHCATWPLLAMPRPLVASLPLPSELVRCLLPGSPLVCEGRGCSRDLTSASKDGCQIRITKDHQNEWAETAPESLLLLTVHSTFGGSWCYSTAVEIQIGCSPLVWNSFLHLCNIYHSKRGKKKAL